MSLVHHASTHPQPEYNAPDFLKHQGTRVSSNAVRDLIAERTKELSASQDSHSHKECVTLLCSFVTPGLSTASLSFLHQLIRVVTTIVLSRSTGMRARIPRMPGNSVCKIIPVHG